MIRLRFLCVAAVFSACFSRADVVLVREGGGAARLVLPADAHVTVALAAEELNAHINLMTGRTFPVVRTAPPGGAVIHLGAPDAGWAAEVDLGSLAFDGFVVDVAGDRVILAGNVPAGTLNAVYWFLEQLGVRWYIPTDLGRNVPARPTLAVGSMRERVEPAFLCRKNHGIERSIRGHGDVWQRRVRITDMGYDVPFNRYSHNLAVIVRVSGYSENHPEYFPLRNGVRRIPEKHYSWQPCTSNPEVVQLAVQAAKDFWEKHPEANFFSVGMNDGRGWCECEACRAMDIPGYTFRGRDVKSERYFTFVKQVAEVVQRTHPDKWITCIAYSSVEPVPRGVELPGNVMVVITQDVGAWHDPAYRAEDESLARAWVEAAGAFGVYNYTSEMWLLPRSYPHLMADALRFYGDIGAVAMTNESWPTWWYAGPMLYARAKLMWDPQQDVDDILEDYYSGFFGPARAPMKRLYDRFEETMLTERPGRWFYGINSVPDQIALWRPDQLEASLSDLGEAKRFAVSAPFDERVEFVAKGFALTEAILREYWHAMEVRRLASEPDVPLDPLIGALGRLSRLTDRRRQIFEEVMEDELLSGTYDRLINERGGRLSSWKGDLSSAYAQTMGMLLGRGETVDAKRLRQIAGAGGVSIRKQVEAFAWILEHPDAENLCPNPGFEATTGQAPTGVNWVSTNSPPGWSKWSIDRNTDCLTWEPAGGRSEPRCGKIAGARLATFIASIPVKVGERYYTSVWAKSTGSSEQVPRLEVKWKTAKGAWVSADANQSVSGVGGTRRWQLLGTLVDVPEGADNLILLPRAADQQPDDLLLLDDVRVIRIP